MRPRLWAGKGPVSFNDPGASREPPPAPADPTSCAIAALIERRREQFAAEQQRLRAQDATLASVREEILSCLTGTPVQDCNESA